MQSAASPSTPKRPTAPLDDELNGDVSIGSPAKKHTSADYEAFHLGTVDVYQNGTKFEVTGTVGQSAALGRTKTDKDFFATLIHQDVSVLQTWTNHQDKMMKIMAFGPAAAKFVPLFTAGNVVRIRDALVLALNDTFPMGSNCPSELRLVDNSIVDVIVARAATKAPLYVISYVYRYTIKGVSTRNT